MYNLNYMISFYMFFMACFMLFFFYKHLLLILISLEFIMINVYYNFYNIMIMVDVNMYVLIFFLVFGVCEGALGLSLIIMIVRCYGNDYLNSISLMKW